MQEVYENEDYHYDGSMDHHDGDMSGDDRMGDDDDEFNKARSKRRSKNDNVGRTYSCGCNKSYLSYPALYTQNKQKHNGVAPEGTKNAQFNTGRGRGRPRKETIKKACYVRQPRRTSQHQFFRTTKAF